MYRRRRIYKRKFRRLEDEGKDYIVRLDPRTMDLVPDAVVVKLTGYYSEDLLLHTDNFPLPIYRTVCLDSLRRRFFTRHLMNDGTIAANEVQQRYPNNHYSVDHPLGWEFPFLAQLAKKYSRAQVNGAKASIGVRVTSNVRSVLDANTSDNGNRGMPIDCWFGSPANPRELLAVSQYWSPVREYLNESYADVDTNGATGLVPRQEMQDSTMWATKLYGQTNAIQPSTHVYSPGPYYRPASNTATRPNLRWLFQQTSEESPTNYKHVLINVKAPEDNAGRNSADFTAVYNPKAYWGSFIKEEAVHQSLDYRVPPEEHLEAIKDRIISATTATNYQLRNHVINGASVDPTATNETLNAVGSLDVTSVTWPNSFRTTLPAGYGNGYRYDQLEKHLWILLVPRGIDPDPNASYAWPAMSATPSNDFDNLVVGLQKGINFRFGIKHKVYLVLHTRRDSEDFNDVVPMPV